MTNTNSTVLCVNSTVQATRDHFKDGQISPLHYWGYTPEPGDRNVGHRRNRWEIKLRYYLGGLDLAVLATTLGALLGGVRKLYLISQPDLIQALPLLKFLFPRLKIVTWVWSREEVRAWKKYLKCCDHVFSLTDIALDELNREKFAGSCSLGIWGCEPDFYRNDTEVAVMREVLFLGIASRDINMVCAAAEKRQFKVSTTPRVMQQAKTPPPDCFEMVDSLGTYRELVRLLWESRVCVIPLFKGDGTATGYTNLIEGLLCGNAVVIGDSGTIPARVLGLPGVYLYRAGDLDSFMEKILRALEDSSAGGFRSHIRESARTVLNGKALRETLESVFSAE